MSKRKPHNNLAGYVAERRNRVTGAYVAIVDQQLAQAGEIVQAWHIDQDGPEEAGRYLVVCTHHKACTATTSIPKARRLMEDPASFCDRCSAQDQGSMRAARTSPSPTYNPGRTYSSRRTTWHMAPARLARYTGPRTAAATRKLVSWPSTSSYPAAPAHRPKRAGSILQTCRKVTSPPALTDRAMGRTS
jgi:hypothetical protein